MTKFVIGNLKANILNLSERDNFISFFKRDLAGKKLKNIQIILCPPFPHLEFFSANFSSKSVQIGAQNVFWEEKGSFTGEVTVPMLKSVGVSFVIVGHSERREYFGETNEIANLKIKNLLKNGLVPIYCIGETKEEREKQSMKKVISSQILEGLDGINKNFLEKIIIAYEPVWAVGTDVFPTSNEIMEARILIRKILAEKYGLKNALKVEIIYGGSVNAKMVKQVCLDPEMDGVLVGRQSLVPSEFIKIAEIINEG